ncbi:hypothetical protein NSTCB13_05606 [Nostoc sp. DSM 114160]|jgi:hypothetical protein
MRCDFLCKQSEMFCINGRNLVWKGFGNDQDAGGRQSGNNLVIVFLEECLKQEPRTYNSSQLARKLESDRAIIRHNCFLKIYAAEVSSSNVGSSKVSSSKIRPCQIRISKVSPTQVSLTQISLT